MTVSFDLNNVPAPDVIQSIEFEALLQEIKDDILKYDPMMASVIDLESEPANKLAQAFAYRIMIERNQANSMAKSIMLAHATGADLDNLGALPFFNVERQPDEDDDSFRQRIRFSLSSLSIAGPESAYIYHALSAHTDIKSAGIDTPEFERVNVDQSLLSQLPDNAIVLTPRYTASLSEPYPCDVAVTILSKTGNGQATADEINAVVALFERDDIIPITDHPRVRSAEIIEFDVLADLTLYPNADSDNVTALAKSNLESLFERQLNIGYDVTRSAIISAVSVEGVQNVALTTPANDIEIDNHQAGHCTSITINTVGYDT